ncbi:MAG: FliM/FliN family flagellar motor switch protein [Pseudomonas sp.]|jgi:type III secretion protein Q|uniref:FliM/FliN family flagellar motor switch protein n=1 Tax=Pseudomonas sp. TaxID=306 RepID=UPI0023A46AB1|nr:FliM/FliN family flagellar motor switch protein [Pseudomonas sp.]MDE1195951.1 FliM/FliN family flagellar motor switch protein [Pseudomonas sp.]
MANEALYDEALDIAPDNEYDETSDGYEDEQPHTHAEPDWQEPAHEHPEAEEPLNLDPLDQLPMALTLRCGSLNLTLGDLRRIAAGSVLEVSGVTPGYATLCHGDRVVAEGELVDVEGRLGLQITRMATPA